MRENVWCRARKGRQGRKPTSNIPGIWKEERAEYHPTWNKDECQEPTLGISHMTTDHSNISTCPCSQLPQLRHTVLKYGIVLPSKERIVLLCLRDETGKQFWHPNNLLILSIRGLPPTACYPQLCALILNY